MSYGFFGICLNDYRDLRTKLKFLTLIVGLLNLVGLYIEWSDVSKVWCKMSSFERSNTFSTVFFLLRLLKKLNGRAQFDEIHG